MAGKFKILFVCLGNICRSPMAHAILEAKLKNTALADDIIVDSAGTSAFHVGEMPDNRTMAILAENNIKFTHKSRQLVSGDLESFDLVLVMDTMNYHSTLSLAMNDIAKAKIMYLRSFANCQGSDLSVPDPYTGGHEQFREIFTICREAIDGLFAKLPERMAQMS